MNLFRSTLKQELALIEARMPLVAAAEARAGEPRTTLPFAAKSGGNAGWNFARPGLGDTGSSAKLTRPYEQSAWIQRAITLKAGEITSAPLKFFDGDEEFEETSFADWWKRPFIGPGKRRLSSAEGRAIQAAWTDLEGEIFYVLGDDWLVPFPNMRTLSPILIPKPCRMRHVVQGGEIIGWEFTDGGGKAYALLPEQVIHRPLFNPYDDFRGLAPVKSVMNAAESDYLAGVYVRNLMRNNGDQGVYIIAKGQVPTDPQREQMIEQLREKKRRAQRGEFSAAFLTGDITVEDAKAQAPGADINASRLMSRHEIFIGLGLPASMADIKASYSIGAASDRYQLITGTCQPLARLIDEPLGDLASRQTGRVLTAEADWDDHPVVDEVRTERLKNADGLWAKGMPLSEINDYLDLGMKPFPGWDVGYLPFSVVPAGVEEPAADPALAETTAPAAATDDPELEQLRLAMLARRRAKARACVRTAPAGNDPFAAYVCACHGVDGFEMRARDPKQVAQWREHMAQRRESIRGYESTFGRQLMIARRETLAKIERTYVPAGKQLGPAGVTPCKRAAAADLVFDLAKWSEGLIAAMRKQAATAYNKSGKQLFTELGNDDPFAFPPAEVLEYARSRDNKISGVADEVHGRITATLEDGITAGDTTDELAARIRAEYNAIDVGRSRVIAMTETSAAYGQGRQEAMETAGVTHKQWLTSGNSTVRATHAAANDQIVPIDGFYDVGGEQLSHPGDPAGSPENVINCHCVSIPVEGPEA